MRVYDRSPPLYAGHFRHLDEIPQIYVQFEKEMASGHSLPRKATGLASWVINRIARSHTHNSSLARLLPMNPSNSIHSAVNAVTNSAQSSTESISK